MTLWSSKLCAQCWLPFMLTLNWLNSILLKTFSCCAVSIGTSVGMPNIEEDQECPRVWRFFKTPSNNSWVPGTTQSSRERCMAAFYVLGAVPAAFCE